jgi:hypothetical protein
MATHLVAWEESIDQATLGRITLEGDDVLTELDADRFLVPADYRYIHWAFAGGISLTRAQIHTPSLDQQRMLLEIFPRKRGTDELPTRTALQLFKPMRPVELQPNEQLEVQTAEDGVAATQQTALVALGPAELPPVPPGPVMRWRATGTTTLVVRDWTNVVLTLDNALPPGTYGLVGFIPASAGCIAARAVFQGGGYRPGVLGLGAAELAGGDFDETAYNRMNGYLMGTFTHLTVPQFQFFSLSADVAETIIMDLIRTGPGPGQTL